MFGFIAKAKFVQEKKNELNANVFKRMTGIDEHKRRTKKNYNHIRLILRMDIDFTKNYGL